jgi:hypothetical protein
VYKILIVKPHNEDHLEDPRLDKRTKLKWISEKLNVRFCTGFIWLRITTSGGLF